MLEHKSVTVPTALQAVRELTHRVGSDPLLTQASTGNSSVKLDGMLWIKASGKWMADALRDDILVPLDLQAARECIRRALDPTERFPQASLETAMHVTLPHRVVLHVHCVNTIAWAVREDGPVQLQRRLEGLHWHWIPYVESGLPLARSIENALHATSSGDVFVLGNHGLVIGGEGAAEAEDLLSQVKQRLNLTPRQAHPADYAELWEASRDSHWELPEDEHLHTLGTDVTSQAVLRGGLLYPCQAILSESAGSDLFRAIPVAELYRDWKSRYRNRPFLIIQGRGVLVKTSIAPAELAMLSGLAQVVQRLDLSSPLRYLTAEEVAYISSSVADRYRELAGARAYSATSRMAM